MIFVIPEMDMFAISLEEAKDFVDIECGGSRGPAHESVEVLIYNMSPMDFLVKHWIGGGNLPEPNLKMTIQPRTHH